MDENEVAFFAKGLLVKIYIITGWTIPEDEFRLILNDQFRKKLSESYSMVNPDEVEYAFRTFGTQVKDWGKQMNLSLIDEVMIPYLEQRKEVSKLEEQKKALPEPAKEMTDEETETFIKSYKNQNTDVRLLPEFLYQWLVDRSRITKLWDQEDSVQNAIALRKSEIMKGLEIEPSSRSLLNERSELKRMLAQGFLEGNEVGRIQSLAKKILIREYLNTLA